MKPASASFGFDTASTDATFRFDTTSFGFDTGGYNLQTPRIEHIADTTEISMVPCMSGDDEVA